MWATPSLAISQIILSIRMKSFLGSAPNVRSQTKRRKLVESVLLFESLSKECRKLVALKPWWFICRLNWKLVEWCGYIQCRVLSRSLYHEIVFQVQPFKSSFLLVIILGSMQTKCSQHSKRWWFVCPLNARDLSAPFTFCSTQKDEVKRLIESMQAIELANLINAEYSVISRLIETYGEDGKLSSEQVECGVGGAKFSCEI